VFTARYGLMPYINQITFSLQKVKKGHVSVIDFKLTSGQKKERT
jgi:hypothetical protein